MYGDDLFDIDEEEVDDRQSAKTFVETFYKVYAYYYVKMEPDLEQDVERLRKTYCTSGMEEKYVRLKEELKWEAPLFNPVIGNADFDAFWYKSLQVSPIAPKGCFVVSYGYTKLRVCTQSLKGKYRISDIEDLP